jgi:hypothetical protein
VVAHHILGQSCSRGSTYRLGKGWMGGGDEDRAPTRTAIFMVLPEPTNGRMILYLIEHRRQSELVRRGGAHLVSRFPSHHSGIFTLPTARRVLTPQNGDTSLAGGKFSFDSSKLLSLAPNHPISSQYTPMSRLTRMILLRSAELNETGKEECISDK